MVLGGFVARASLPSTPVLVSLSKWSIQHRHKKAAGHVLDVVPQVDEVVYFIFPCRILVDVNSCARSIGGITYTISVEVAVRVIGA